MKKLFAIIVALALTAALCISSFAGLDSLYINANTLDSSNIAGEAGKSKVTIEKGDKLFILGWMAKQGTTLEKIYWTLDGVEKECSDVYRDRTEIAALEVFANAGWVADEFVNAGFGKDDGYMEMLGVDSLENGTYSVAIVAKYAAGRILFCLEGHHHCDSFSHLNGILHICEACDAAYSDYLLHTPFSGTLPAKTAGTIYEQTFDALQIDPANDLLYTTRIGGGQDRVFHTNVVRVPAGSTFRFSAPNLSGALTWACYDGDQSVHDTTARAPEGYVTLFNAHALSVDADGTLHAGTPGPATVLAMDADYRKEVYCVQVV